MRGCIVLLLLSSLALAACQGTDSIEAKRAAAHNREAVAIVLSAKEKNLLRIADTARASGNAEEAEKTYRQAMGLSQGAVDAHLALAALLETQKKPEAMLAVLQEARALQPRNPELLRLLGNALIGANRPQEALESFAAWLEIEPREVRAQNGRGVALDLLGRPEEAQKAYREAIENAGGDAAYLQNNLALSLLMTGDYAEAVALLESLHKDAPDNATLRRNLALAYGLAGEEKKAAAMSAKELSKSQIEENRKFYEYYRTHAKGASPAAKASETSKEPSKDSLPSVPAAIKPMPLLTPLDKKEKPELINVLPTKESQTHSEKPEEFSPLPAKEVETSEEWDEDVIDDALQEEVLEE